MLIVFPIGGKGQRFKEAGYTKTKPLIELDGKPLWQWAEECYIMGTDENRIIKIIRANIKSFIPFSYDIDRSTSGPVETLLEYPALLNTDEELLIADCDSLIDNEELKAALTYFRNSKAYGGVTVRETDDPACSYAELRGNLVLRTKEKECISKWSTTGPYWWRFAGHFLHYAEKAHRDGVTSCSEVYNYAIKDKKDIIAFPVKTFQHLGTPELLEKYAHDHSFALSK